MSLLRAAFLEAPGAAACEVIEAEILATEAEIFAALHDTIRRSRERVSARFYRIWPDATGHAFAQELIAAARRGVRVRLVLDAIGSLGVDVLLDELRDAGVRVLLFNPLSGLGEVDINVRDHAKLVVADGERAWCTSANISDSYARSWNDCGLYLVGEIAAELDDEFETHWDGLRAGVVPSPTGPPHKVPWTEPQGHTIARVVTNGFDGYDLRAHVMAMLAAASRRVDVHHCYLTDPLVVDALARRAVEGLYVRVVAPEHSDLPAVDLVMSRDIQRLVEAGVRYVHLSHMSHRKYLSVDHDWMLFGSSNLDGRSLDTNLEVNVALYSDRLGRSATRRLISRDARRGRRLKGNPLRWWHQPGAAMMELVRRWL